jgi:hypothetical protein
MRERREIAACADAAAAGNYRIDVVVQQIAQTFRNHRPRAGKPFGKHVGAQQHQRADLFFAEGRSQARGVTADQVMLQRRDLIAADMNIREFAEAGGNSKTRSSFTIVSITVRERDIFFAASG